MRQGQQVAIRHLGLWQYGSFIRKEGWQYHFRVGRQTVKVGYNDVEFPAREYEEE